MEQKMFEALIEFMGLHSTLCAYSADGRKISNALANKYKKAETAIKSFMTEEQAQKFSEEVNL